MPVPRNIGARVFAAAALAAACAAFAAGCGADTEGGGGGGGLSADDHVRAVVARFGIATRDKDYQEICDQLLADVLITKLEDVGLPCEATLQRALADVRNPTLTINEVSIAGARALVSVHTTATGQSPSDDALQVVRQSNGWRIASLAAPGGGMQTTTSTPPAQTPATETETPTTQTSSTASSKKSKSSKSAKKQKSFKKDK